MSTQKMSKDLSNFIGVYLLIGIVAAVAAWLLFYSKQLDAITVNRQDRAVVVQKNDQLHNLADATQVLRNNFEKVREDRDTVLRLLPQQDEAERLLVILGGYASDAGVVLGSFTPQGGGVVSKEDLGFEPYEVQISLLGKYQNIRDFISKVESGSRYIDITEYSMNSSTTTERNPDIDSTFMITAYYQTDNTPAQKTPGASSSDQQPTTQEGL